MADESDALADQLHRQLLAKVQQMINDQIASFFGTYLRGGKVLSTALPVDGTTVTSSGGTISAAPQLELTDGTHDLTGVKKITVSGMSVGGTSAAATLTVSAGGSGTVTSVAVSVPSFMAVSGSPVTTSGTLALSFSNQAANTFLRGPTSGGAGAVTFGGIVSADLPVGSAAQLGALQVDGTTITASAGVISAVGGGGSGALTKIAAQTLGASASSITFSSIPGTYTDLILVLVGHVSTVSGGIQQVRWRANGDTGSNYDFNEAYVELTTLGANAGVANGSGQLGWLPDDLRGTAVAGRLEAIFAGYAGTTWDKGSVSVSTAVGGTSTSTYLTATDGNLWRSTAAITSLTVFPASGQFAAGTTAVLYGRG